MAYRVRLPNLYPGVDGFLAFQIFPATDRFGRTVGFASEAYWSICDFLCFHFDDEITARNSVPLYRSNDAVVELVPPTP